MDMTKDLFAELEFGKIALKKLAPTDPHFRLYKAGWLGKGIKREVMSVTGAVFRESTRGLTKGQFTIMVPKTSRTVHVTANEMAEFKDAQKKVRKDRDLGYMQGRGAT